MDKKSSPYFTHLKCRECGRKYLKEAVHVCDFDFGPLEAAYDYDAIRAVLTREAIQAREESMWRYRELLPIDGEPTVGRQVGFTPLVKADRLARRLGVRELYIKNDTVNYPTLSFKDRVVSVALSRARELGFQVVACASTGNLANSVAANAASAGLKSYVLIPADLEQGKVLGSLVYGTNVIAIQGAYDQVNRLCSEIAGKYGWGFVNVNLRPYYAEGSKTMGFEIAEQFGWKLPRHTVVPMASGSLLTKISKA
jgi:threonine synthase